MLFKKIYFWCLLILVSVFIQGCNPTGALKDIFPTAGKTKEERIAEAAERRAKKLVEINHDYRNSGYGRQLKPSYAVEYCSKGYKGLVNICNAYHSDPGNRLFRAEVYDEETKAAIGSYTFVVTPEDEVIEYHASRYCC